LCPKSSDSINVGERAERFDEIGDVELGIQVKLLRVLQTRTFQRLGETEDRQFAGKLVAATNRDLEAVIAAGRFREDL
jgi:transcriptional regulator with GAF, ATPase, and Fis domain